MSIRVREEKCVGCGRCRSVCPGNLLIAAAGGKTVIREVRDCWGCAACLKACPYQALEYYLGADMGGRGGSVCVERQGYILSWVFTDNSAEVRVLTIDSRNANSY